MTIRSGGSRGAAGNNNGSDGGASSFAGSGITMVVGNGGKGGEGDGGGTGFNIHDGGDGGTASGGDVNRAGDGGGNAVRTSFAGVTGSRPSYHASGGGSALGGMRRQPDMDVAGADGRSYGGGRDRLLPQCQHDRQTWRRWRRWRRHRHRVLRGRGGVERLERPSRDLRRSLQSSCPNSAPISASCPSSPSIVSWRATHVRRRA